jgi:gentisate 1,2-dioxygenase
MEGGALITAEQAERRVLVLENPALRGTSQITSSLYAGLQLILPGEMAPSHRHQASAIRFIIEGSGAYTAVDGERTTMQPGDFIITPAWCYHDHGNPGDQPVVWMDGLDIPIVNKFDAGFAEHDHVEVQPITREEGDALARYGTNLLPVEYKPQRMSSPVFSYPYARTRDILDRLYRGGPLDQRHGIKVQYSNPTTGGYPTPTIAAFIQLLPARFRGKKYRATDATIYCVIEGRGRTEIGDTAFEWGPRDIFVAPSWKPVAHQAREESVLFSFSDRAAQKALGLWRDEEV